MKVEIQTEPLIIYVDGQAVYVQSKQEIVKAPKPDFAGEYAKYRGVKEYEGIVADIQKWYYGKLVEASWCATSLSYFANQLGVLDKIGGKNENVFCMMEACQAASKEGKGQFFDKDNIPTQIEKNDILFWLWKGGEMGVGSSKHVGVAEYDTKDNVIYCIGGNQKDKICTLAYDRACLYAVYRM